MNVKGMFLTSTQKKAIEVLKTKLLELFDIEQLILFGSTARGDFDDESDIDLLVLTKSEYSRSKRHEITDLVFEINLEYGTNISTTVVDIHSWSSGSFSILPIKQEIKEDGVVI